ncbi:MAG: hypothetical protein Kow0089_25090 [Desulfobulbaceae bacterium]
MKEKSFPMAPMTRSILVMTMVLWLIPAAFLAQYLFLGQPVLLYVGWFVLFLYAAIWLFWRPSRFVLSDRGLRIVFPCWSRTIHRSTLHKAELLDVAAFKKRFGTAMRIGAGGLWGGFGWLWTTRGGMIEFYVSRFDTLVLVERTDRKSILITPADPEAFAAALNGMVEPSS